MFFRYTQGIHVYILSVLAERQAPLCQSVDFSFALHIFLTLYYVMLLIYYAMYNGYVLHFLLFALYAIDNRIGQKLEGNLDTKKQLLEAIPII